MLVWMKFKTTADIKIPESTVDQIIGQENAVAIVKKASKQHRNILLIGEPGTGKTMLAQAMAELLPIASLEDVLVYKNVNDENRPIVKVVKTYPNPPEKGKPLGDGQGRQIVQKEKLKGRLESGQGNKSVVPIVILIVAVLFILSISNIFTGYEIVVLAALILGSLIFGSMALFVGGLTKRVGVLPGMFESNEPKLIVDNTGKEHAPFVDGTGSKAGSLFGDVKHDPLQSGGLGTPPHLRVESGSVHKANNGVLFIDEVANLEPRSQQELLTAMQEKRYSITGQSELSSGAIVKTEPVPCDFILVAAGNLQDIQKMHPALRSRIRGYGYEVYMQSSMDDTAANRDKIVHFIAQEIKKDGKIPPFDYEACMEIIEEARRRSGRKNKLSLVLRDLGGLIRAAGDIAIENGKKVVTKQEVMGAKRLAKPIEAQYVEQTLEYRKDYKVFNTEGFGIGRVNGLAVVGSSYLSAGIIIPIVAEVTPASSRSEGKLIATGKLGKLAQEAVKNISAVIKRHMSRDIASYDIHVQFLQTYEGVEGDSASISVAISVISAMEGIPVDQSVAMTGSLSVRGDVLPVGGITGKVEAAIDAGMKKVIIPKSNLNDIYIDKAKLRKIKIITVKNIADVIEAALKKSSRRDAIIRELRKYMSADYKEKPPLDVDVKGK
ncbi:MAG: ATP-dependent protease LonB [Candidatus Micrarchaeota archaeon]|nr:ATP-dependent protease LonB [Candidatus Micrarchaeota archaeon]